MRKSQPRYVHLREPQEVKVGYIRGCKLHVVTDKISSLADLVQYENTQRFAGDVDLENLTSKLQKKRAFKRLRIAGHSEHPLDEQFAQHIDRVCPACLWKTTTVRINQLEYRRMTGPHRLNHPMLVERMCRVWKLHW